MQKFWEKTKKTVTVGFNEAAEGLGAKKVEEDPEFLTKFERLQFIKQHATDLQKSIEGFSNAVGLGIYPML